VVIVGGRNTRPTNPRFCTAANLKKKLLNCHISATVRQILKNEIWHGNTLGPLQITKIAIFQQWIGIMNH